MSSAKGAMPDSPHAKRATTAPTTSNGTTTMGFIRFLIALKRSSVSKAKARKAPTVSSMLPNTKLALTSDPLQTSGSRNFPTGNQPSRKANTQIIIRAKAGVKAVNRVAPDMVAAYSNSPPRRQTMALPRK